MWPRRRRRPRPPRSPRRCRPRPATSSSTRWRPAGSAARPRCVPARPEAVGWARPAAVRWTPSSRTPCRRMRSRAVDAAIALLGQPCGAKLGPRCGLVRYPLW
ncbi:hypothetical protein C5E44_22440 [Nocardia nova]|nr:hypothetical protein C5E44_22440 [Nocardia nova]